MISISQLPAFSRLFSAAVFRELATKGRSPVFARLARETGLSSSSLDGVKDVFEAAFDVLKQSGHRDEYIYKAALTHRVLLGKHNLRTACMLSEFRVGACKADIAILNGTTTVYEIKSERDSLSRLERQLENYKKVFASVFVIAGENHVPALLKATTPDVGVLSLSRRYYLTTVREAINRPERICPSTVFDAIRTNEAKSILTNLGLTVPDVPNTQLHAELRKQFAFLDPIALHSGLLKTLKSSRDMMPLANLVNRVTPSLQAAALSTPLRKSDHERLLASLEVPLEHAMAWG